MKIFLSLVLLLFLSSCNKPRTVLICGDHICVNKAEAEQYFEDNLILEVKVIEKKENKKVSLVELNLKSNSEGKKEVSIFKKDKTDQKIKELSKLDIKKKKEEIKKRKKKLAKKNDKSKHEQIRQSNKKDKIKKTIDNNKTQIKTVNKSDKNITDICTLIEKCSIDEISKYLVKQGKNKDFPNITTREN